jgi:hypothetical protein
MGRGGGNRVFIKTSLTAEDAKDAEENRIDEMMAVGSVFLVERGPRWRQGKDHDKSLTAEHVAASAVVKAFVFYFLLLD